MNDTHRYPLRQRELSLTRLIGSSREHLDGRLERRAAGKFDRLIKLHVLLGTSIDISSLNLLTEILISTRAQKYARAVVKH